MKRFSIAHDETPMPLVAYFTSVGGVLVGFLFLSNAYMDQPRGLFRHGDSNFSIKIKSTASTPDRVVFDTAIPTIVPPLKPQLELVVVNDFVTKAYGELREPKRVVKERQSNRSAKKPVMDVVRVTSHEGINYPPSW